MKLFCCYTPAHEILLRNYFSPSILDTFAVTSFKLEIGGPGDFLSPEFLRCICQKIDLILDSIRENSGVLIAWADVDIQFFDLHPDLLSAQLGEHDIAFQREGRSGIDVNAGFFVCRCNARTSRFFLRVKEGLRQNPSANEQYIINQLIRERTLDLSWTYLPVTYYARTHGWPPPSELALYHANATVGKDGIGRKIKQFKELALLRRFRIPTLIVTSIKYAPKRIFRLLSERQTPHRD